MNRPFWMIVLLGAALLLSACIAPGGTVPAVGPDSPPAATEATAPVEPTTPIEEEPMAEPGQDATGQEIGEVVRQMAAQQLGVDAEAVAVVAVESVDWPDACLGVSQPDVMCAQVITPGYRVVIEVNGDQYEYHTDATGGQILLASEPES